jgi:predicted DNA-binding transcriptional regulator YafY
MKTDRLLSIIIYLLNHDTVSAAKLAEKFEVSKRTIIRDMEQITLAGIPVKSLPGMNGGYSIIEGYKIDGRLINVEDQVTIITALKGFLSAYDNKRYDGVLEKILSILPQKQEQYIFLDFGASGENNVTQAKLKILEKAINDKKVVKIFYVNAYGETTSRIVEPVVLNYRWYAWYLLAFCTIKQDYRIFKLVRISELELTDIKFSKDHDNPAVLLEQSFQDEGRKSLDIILMCKTDVKIQICEYLGGTITETFENGDFILHMNVLEDERMWFAMLLSFGDKIKVLEPEEVKSRIMDNTKKILSVYNEW